MRQKDKLVFTRIVITIICSAIFVYGSDKAFHHTADITNDGVVNAEDLSKMGLEWQTTGVLADLNKDNYVDISDLGILTEEWLNTLYVVTNPTQPPSIDGQLTEPCWDSDNVALLEFDNNQRLFAQRLTNEGYYSACAPECDAALCWDDLYLYIGIKYNESVETSEPVVMHMGLTLAPNEPVVVLAFDSATETITIESPETMTTINSLWQVNCASTSEKTTWQCEIKLSWDDLQFGVPTIGKTIGIAFDLVRGGTLSAPEEVGHTYTLADFTEKESYFFMPFKECFDWYEL